MLIMRHGQASVASAVEMCVCVCLCLCAATAVTTTTDPYGPQDLSTVGQVCVCMCLCVCAQLLYSVLVHGFVYVQSQWGDIYDQGLS